MGRELRIPKAPEGGRAVFTQECDRDEPVPHHGQVLTRAECFVPSRMLYFLLRKRFKSFPKESQTTWMCWYPQPSTLGQTLGFQFRTGWSQTGSQCRFWVPHSPTLLGLLGVSSAPHRAGQRANLQQFQKRAAESSADIAVLISITKDTFSAGFGGEIWDWFLWGFNGITFMS